MAVLRRHLSDVEGCKVVAEAAGSGEPVLLLHGYPQSASCWRHQIAALAENHHVVAPDWPGLGRSEPPWTAPTYDDEVDRIERFVQRLGWQRFNLCAHDYGGFVGIGCFDTALEAEYLGWVNTSQGRHTFWEFFAHYPVAAVPWRTERLAAIQCPVAVIWGDRDPYIPFDTAREPTDRIPHATLTHLRGADHYIMEERPREVTDALLGLLSRPAASHGVCCGA